MPDLSIIIVNTNNKKILQECLESIYQNTHRISFEIIVSDNASSDGSPEMVKTKFPQARLIENQENLGFTKASNQGLKIYNARYALLLNNDTIVKDSALDRMIEFMDLNPSAGACGAKLLNLDGSIQRQGGMAGKRFWLAKKPTPVDFATGAALLVRKEVIDKVGILDENLFFYNDDLDWCRSIRKAGWKIYFLPQAEIIHYGGYSSRRVFNPKLFVEGFAGGLYFCRKHYGETAFHLYRILLGFIILFALPFHIFNPNKFKAYVKIVHIAWHGQISKPVLK